MNARRISWTSQMLLALLLGLLVYGPLATQPAHAQRSVTVVSDRSGTSRTTAAQNTLTAAATGLSANADAAIAYKEFTLDPIAYALARKIIQKMVASIVTWINSGFQGSPAFITDLRGFLADVADEVAGDFIYNSDLGFMCNPFELDVRIALATNYNRVSSGYQPQCTLTGVVNNVENFLQGAFNEGGWAGWFELTQGESNDPNRAYFEARAEMYAAIRDAQGNVITELDWGDGFLSFKVCSDSQAQSGAVTNCTITTPGRVIADQLNEALGVGRDSLITADEVNEIIGALLAQLAQQALTGINGLLGLGGNSSYTDYSYSSNSAAGAARGTGTSSYLGALVNENPVQGGPGSAVGSSSIQAVAITDAIEAERERLTYELEIQTTLTDLRTDYETRRDVLDAYNRSSCEAPSYPTRFTNWLSDAQAGITQSQATLVALNELQNRFNTATSPEVQNEVANGFLSLQQQGTLTTAVTNTQLELFIEFDVEPAIADFREDLRDAEDRCANSFRDD